MVPDTSRCLDAFTVALNQAREGNNKRCYAFALELQLASLELYRACRSFPAMRVRIRSTTPANLWSAREVQAEPRTRIEQDTSSPVVKLCGRAVRACKCNFATNTRPIAGVVWPASLQELNLVGSFNQPIPGGVAWPASLRELYFGHMSTQPIVGVTWPASLEKLSFGQYFDQPTVGVVWPVSLQQLQPAHHWSDVADLPGASTIQGKLRPARI